MRVDLEPAGVGDVARCVWSLATWLYPVPAMLGAMALRRMDVSAQQQALLDGVYWRIVLRQLVGPLAAGAAIVAVLAMQEYAVYEPTGISVIATETRMVFETGAFSSTDNPITAVGPPPAWRGLPDQRARAAAAVATSLPMLAIIAVLTLLAARTIRSLSAPDGVNVGAWPRALDAPRSMVALSWVIVAGALGVPVVALFLSLRRAFEPLRVWTEFGPQLHGSMLVAAIAGAVALALSMLAVVRRSRAALFLSVASFLIGGQLVAIALIRTYNRPATAVIYESAVAVVMAYVARFGWIALAAAEMTQSPTWRHLRDMAAVDGATPWQTARAVIWPIAWPTLAAGALLLAALSLSEVPATVLLAPQRPQLLTPLMMTWVHMRRDDAMIEASLLTAGMVLMLGCVAVGLAALGRRVVSVGKGQMSVKAGADRSPPASRAPANICLLTFAFCLLTSQSACDPIESPDEVWLDTGIAAGQVVYPRAIAYSPKDNTFFICDRTAHVQHIDSRGRYLAGWHMPESAQGKPVGLTVGPDGNLYVADTHYHRVIVYTASGKEVRRFGANGTAPGRFIYPTDIAFDAKGNLFVSEYGDNDRIQVFDARDGRFLYSFGRFGSGAGEFSRPQSMVIDGELIYITDACNHRIVVFKTDGTFVRAMGSVGSEPGQFRFPYGMDMDRDGDLVVCEFGNNRVQKIDKHTGRSKAIWGAAGREPGRLAYPWGVAVDNLNRLVAVDAGNNRLQVFSF
jgi:ABC-type Fe3+ transport system permease subunit/DNA-binding beta-propeller fold protein YncE